MVAEDYEVYNLTYCNLKQVGDIITISADGFII